MSVFEERLFPKLRAWSSCSKLIVLKVDIPFLCKAGALVGSLFADEGAAASWYSRKGFPGFCSIQGVFEVSGDAICTLNMLDPQEKVKSEAEPATYTVQYLLLGPYTGYWCGCGMADLPQDRMNSGRVSVQQCISVSTCTWWGTGVLKWLPAGAFIINITSRYLPSSTFSIPLTLLNYGPKPSILKLQDLLPFHLNTWTVCVSSRRQDWLGV